MMTTEQLVEAISRLPKSELRQLKNHLEEMLELPAEDNQAPATTDEVENEKAWDAWMALAGSVNTGEVLTPFPTREQLYDENW